MFKKLLTLAAGAALCFGAQAKLVQDQFIDYSTWSDWNLYEMGYKAYIEDGCLTSTNPQSVNEETGEVTDAWYQYFMAPAWPAEIGQSYEVTFKVKGTDAGNVNVNFRWSWSEDPINVVLPVTTDWEEVTVDVPEIGGTNIDMVWQGTLHGTFQCAWIKVCHNEKESVKPVEWEDWLINGDAEGEYGEVPCAYSKEYKGRAADGSEIAAPEPSSIETVDGSKVFVCHAKTVDPNDSPATFLNDDGTVKGDVEWQNQFWIQSPKAWKTGDIFKVSFDYKASKDAKSATQAHGQNPGGYLHWAMIGDVSFTNEWQHFEKQVTLESAANGAWSVAFNLGANGAYQNDINFYFDNMKWETMKLDEGYFVAGDFNDWNLDEAVELVWIDEHEAYAAIVGDDDNPASEVQISTMRGQDAAFRTNALKISATIVEDDAVDYVVGGGKKVSLPDADIWAIILDPEYLQITFTKDLSGIENVSVTNAPAVYYNLQGVKVNNPSNGIFIVKKGNKVTKQVIR